MSNEYYRKFREVLVLILIINIAIGLVKIIYGYKAGVLSITADGYDSLLDAVSNIVGIVILLVSAKPSDKEHRYGHYKLETFASILISFTLFIVAYEIISSAFERFFATTTPSISITTYLVMIITLIITLIAAYYEKSMAKKLHSNILLSDSEHIKSDALATFIIIISLVFVQLGYTILDPILSIGISLLIIKTGLTILYSNINILLDKNILSTYEIEDVVKDINEIKEVHNVRTRGTASTIFLDMHLVLSKDLSLADAHRLSHICEEKICEEYPEIKDVLIHIEPEEGMDDKIEYE